MFKKDEFSIKNTEAFHPEHNCVVEKVLDTESGEIEVKLTYNLKTENFFERLKWGINYIRKGGQQYYFKNTVVLDEQTRLNLIKFLKQNK